MTENFAWGVFAGMIFIAGFMWAQDVRNDVRTTVNQNDYIIRLLQE